jgi:hypothetical protein
VIVDGGIGAQAGELAHRRLRTLRLFDVGHDAPGDFHRHHRVRVQVRLDRDLARFQFLRRRFGSLCIGLRLRLHRGGSLVELRFFLLAATAKRHRQQRGGKQH